MSALLQPIDQLTFNARYKLVDVKHVPKSSEPYKVYLKRNGVFLKGCATQDEVNDFVATVPADKLIVSKSKVTRTTRPG